jgi:hypothetical protein
VHFYQFSASVGTVGFGMGEGASETERGGDGVGGSASNTSQRW